MASFKRSTSLSGKFKGVIVKDGMFIDCETSEVIDVAAILEKVYGNNPIDITTSYKADEELE